MVCATDFPSVIVISMRLPDSLLKIWAMIKGLEQIKDSVKSKYFNFFGLNFMFPGYNIYQAVTSPDWDGDMKVCIVIKGRLYCKSVLNLPCVKDGVPSTGFILNNMSNNCILLSSLHCVL